MFVAESRMVSYALGSRISRSWPLSTLALPQVRQLQQVFQGLLQSTPERYNADPTKLVRLWLHESERTCKCRGQRGGRLGGR